MTNYFQKILGESKSNPNNILIDKVSEIYTRLMNSFLQNNDIETYSTHNEGKCVISERFIRTYIIYKYMISTSKNVDKLNDIFIKNNNTYWSTIKMKPFDVKLSTYIGSSKEVNHKDPERKIGDIVRIS